MHCDWVNISIPDSSYDEVYSELMPILYNLGELHAVRLAQSVLYRFAGSTGTFKETSKKGFTIFGASGAFLGLLRANGSFDDYLSCFAGRPHRVTKMDVAHDVPVDARPVLSKLYAKCKAGKVALTRKTISPGQFHFFKGAHSLGGDTGTLYLGNRTSEVHAKVYDKQSELLDKGIPCDDFVTRYELSATSKVGITLKDVHSPESLFWHYMGKVLKAPANVAPWVKNTCEGFQLPPRAELDPMELLRKQVLDNPSLEALVKLADSGGANGFTYLVSLLRQSSQTQLAS